MLHKQTLNFPVNILQALWAILQKQTMFREKVRRYLVHLEPHTHKIYKASNYMEVQFFFRRKNPLPIYPLLFYANRLFIYKILRIYHFSQSTVHYTLFLNDQI